MFVQKITIFFVKKTKQSPEGDCPFFPIFIKSHFNLCIDLSESHEEILDVISVYHRLK